MSVYVGTWEVLFDKFKLALSNRDNLKKKSLVIPVQRFSNKADVHVTLTVKKSKRQVTILLYRQVYSKTSAVVL